MKMVITHSIYSSQETHTLTRKEGGASPENREYNKTNNSLDCFNNNRDLDTVPHVEIEDSTMISTDCSFASHEVRSLKGCGNEGGSNTFDL